VLPRTALYRTDSGPDVKSTPSSPSLGLSISIVVGPMFVIGFLLFSVAGLDLDVHNFRACQYSEFTNLLEHNIDLGFSSDKRCLTHVLLSTSTGRGWINLIVKLNC